MMCTEILFNHPQTFTSKFDTASSMLQVKTDYDLKAAEELSRDYQGVVPDVQLRGTDSVYMHSGNIS